MSELDEYMREAHPGFVRCTPEDSSGRRAMWVKWDPSCVLELRSGREGDDAHVVLIQGHILTKETLWEILSLIDRVRNDCGGEEVTEPWIP
jgi:hypothetical protein